MKLLASLVSFLLLGCAATPEPIIDQATVTSKNASLRLKNSSTSRTLRLLENGEKIEVLERQDNWYRVRYGRDVQGWMDASTIQTNETKELIQKLATESQNLEPQNTAVLKQDSNLRLEPGRSSSIIRKLDSGTKVEVLERVTKPRPNSDSSYDMWMKVRPAPREVGWILSQSLEFDIPAEISQYSEDYTYTAVKTINRVQDPLAGQINWFVIGERRGGDPNIDFQGVRVFTWNMKKHRYETAYRTHNMRAVYPLEVGQEGPNPTFRIYELADDGTTKVPRDYVLYGVIVREKKDS
jgi:uncharacterized protein YgiM (DUF1202 family)